MDADLYDEFGNYIGPEIEDEEEEEAPVSWMETEEVEESAENGQMAITEPQGNITRNSEHSS
jgi:hypothetical protein